MATNKKDIAYDPDQNVEEKRDVRRKYRVLEKNIQDDPNLSMDHILQTVQSSNELFNNVKTPDDAMVDSRILKQVASIGAQKAKSIKGGPGSFDVDDFISKVLSYVGVRGTLDEDESDADGEVNSTRLNWDKIGRKALGKSRRVPTTDFMLGPLSIEQKKRTVTKRAKLEKNKDDLRKPQEIREEDIARSENETSINVARLENVLAAQGPVNLFKFVINPNDFAQSVENIFHLAFSIRDGKVALETSETGEPIIYACETPTDEERADGQLQKRQILMEFDMATWRRAIEVFNITEPMIPQRPPAKTKIGNKWYG